MIPTWRWFGPTDPVRLSDARQAGATGIVTALHHVPTGETWSVAEITKRKSAIAKAGLKWAVAESIPVHENIKTRSGQYKTFVENYKKSLFHLSECGIHTVCYNFMPVLDATRTNFDFKLPNGSRTLFFGSTAFAAFELFLLKRPGAEAIYDQNQQEDAKVYLKSLSRHQRDKLIATIVAGFPGVGANYTLSDFQSILDTYKNIGPKALKENLSFFLNEIIPVAEEAGVKMAIHPDDPPFPVLGLPRIVSTEQDIQQLLGFKTSNANGFCLCTGSLGVLKENDLPGIVKRLGNSLHFVHLRNIQREEDGSFFESSHLEGAVDMFEVVKALVEEQRTRIKAGREDIEIPMRPDHGHQILDDINKDTIPGYSAIGRLKGLAEIRGLEVAIQRFTSSSVV